MQISKTHLDLEQVAALGALHAEVEGQRDLDAVMATLSDNPVYEYPVIGKKFSGRDNALRFYQYFFANFSPNVTGARMFHQWVNATSVTQEYEIDCNFAGEQECHRILGVLLVEGDKLCGERVYASAATIRRMIGPLYDDLIDL